MAPTISGKYSILVLTPLLLTPPVLPLSGVQWTTLEPHPLHLRATVKIPGVTLPQAIDCSGGSMVWSHPRITASRIAISPDEFQAIVMNLLHGHHAAASMLLGNLVFAILGSHKVSTP